MTQQTLIQAQQKSQLKRTFRKDLKAEVLLRLFTQRPSPISVPGRECRYCVQTQQLLEELVALSPKVTLETTDVYAQPEMALEEGITRVPAIAFGKKGKAKLRFFGIPMGYQLAVVVENIKTISRGVSPLSMDTRKKLRIINQPVHIQVFVTPTSAECPPIARLAHALALENQNITADVVETEEFPALTQKYSVRSVPCTVVNELTQIPGLVTESEFVEKIMQCGVRQESNSAPVQS
ncbi:MAG: thioredoxin family protein [Dehalococcoidia bacterium]|nr:thioredoxin family protein [Dehalococcoidia bacterium]